MPNIGKEGTASRAQCPDADAEERPVLTLAVGSRECILTLDKQATRARDSAIDASRLPIQLFSVTHRMFTAASRRAQPTRDSMVAILGRTVEARRGRR